MNYTIRRAAKRPELKGLWDGPVWSQADTLDVANFRAESSAHRPKVQARLLYDAAGIYGMFRVHDQYVRCVHTKFQDAVCRDSCVEFFVQPKPTPGYFNFEFSGGGAFLVYYVEDHTRTAEGFKKRTEVTAEDGRQVQVYHSLPSVVEPEITTDTEWRLEFAIPFRMLEKYAGALGDVRGQRWRANFYKCGDQTSHPHWASWAPVDALNFHLPHCFGTLVFAD